MMKINEEIYDKKYILSNKSNYKQRKYINILMNNHYLLMKTGWMYWQIPGLYGSQFLKRYPDFCHNSTHIYNILKRLKKNQLITRKGTRNLIISFTEKGEEIWNHLNEIFKIMNPFEDKEVKK